ncbi:MAG: DUF167 domain-containing protein [Bryobacteraceae bacterium]
MNLADLQAALQRDRRLDLTLKVIPKSAKNEIAGFLEDGTMKLKIHAVPEKGKANAEVCEFLANVFGVGKRNVQLVRGETSAHKQVLILL